MCVNGRSYASELKKWTESEVRVLRRDRELLDKAMVDATFFLPDTPSVTEYDERMRERIADELDEMVDAASHADDTCEKLSDLAGRIRKLAATDGERS